MEDWSFYSLVTGRFSGSIFRGNEKNMIASTPAGWGALQGIFTSSQCVDLNTMQVIPCQPEKPEDTELLVYEWEESAGQWIGYPTTLAVEIQERAKRDQMLSSSDWTQLPDAPITEQELQEWRQYRQALRSVPEQPGFPYEIEWPAAPAGSAL